MSRTTFPTHIHTINDPLRLSSWACPALVLQHLHLLFQVRLAHTKPQEEDKEVKAAEEGQHVGSCRTAGSCAPGTLFPAG